MEQPGAHPVEEGQVAGFRIVSGVLGPEGRGGLLMSSPFGQVWGGGLASSSEEEGWGNGVRSTREAGLPMGMGREDGSAHGAGSGGRLGGAAMGCRKLLDIGVHGIGRGLLERSRRVQGGMAGARERRGLVEAAKAAGTAAQ